MASVALCPILVASCANTLSMVILVFSLFLSESPFLSVTEPSNHCPHCFGTLLSSILFHTVLLIIHKHISSWLRTHTNTTNYSKSYFLRDFTFWVSLYILHLSACTNFNEMYLFFFLPDKKPQEGISSVPLNGSCA